MSERGFIQLEQQRGYNFNETKESLQSYKFQVKFLFLILKVQKCTNRCSMDCYLLLDFV